MSELSLLQRTRSLVAGGAKLDGVGTTAVVLKTYGAWTPWMDFVVGRYSKQLTSIDIQLHVLRDVSSEFPSLKKVRTTEYIHPEGQVAPLCEVTWDAAKRLLGGKHKLLNETKHSWTADPHILTTVFEVLWWEECAPQLLKEEEHFVWFIEQDAFFNGDLARFVKAYVSEDADYVARGFRIAGPHWWLYGQFADGLSSGLKTFGVEDDLVKNVWPLPELTEGKCNQSTPDNKRGLLLAQDHVTRYSSRFLGMLTGAAARGITGPGEGFKATLCASRLGLGKGEPCSMRDFAPIRDPSRSNATSENWVSPVYCWVQVGPEPGRPHEFDTDDLPCSQAWLDKWVHPVKVSSAALRLHEC